MLHRLSLSGEFIERRRKRRRRRRKRRKRERERGKDLLASSEAGGVGMG